MRHISYVMSVLCVTVVGFNLSTTQAFAPTAYANEQAESASVTQQAEELPIIVSETSEASQTPPENKWLCSCVKGTRLHVPTLPRGDADSFTPNSVPFVGGVVILEYSNGVRHIAPIDAIRSDAFHVIHYNKKECKKTEEWIPWTSRYIVGFYKAP